MDPLPISTAGKDSGEAHFTFTMAFGFPMPAIAGSALKISIAGLLAMSLISPEKPGSTCGSGAGAVIGRISQVSSRLMRNL